MSRQSLLDDYMLTLSDEKHFFAFSKDNELVLRIKSGDSVKIKTMDCFSNQVRKEEEKLEFTENGKVYDSKKIFECYASLVSKYINHGNDSFRKCILAL